MARVKAAWGIDIGQCGLKAIRCRRHPDDPAKAIADAFDYIEYPKILTQPEAEPEQLVREALKLFLSRNEIAGDRVAVSASGQSGLARFIKLPPVETKRIPDIVRYEAKQQIPFDLEDVIWDYQRMGGGLEEDEYALETEVGLFAMKRDQVDEAVRPLREAGIDVEIVQLTPLAIYNAMVFDRIGELQAEEDYDPDDPPPSLAAISVGTETTDMVITNGFRVWQRNIPLGGSHFTRALTKDLNLTYAKAEHLKRNAAQAEDPKAIYQAMRGVFKDFLTQIQLSIGYFQSLDRAATIDRVVAMGHSMKLPGLRRYLSQNLGYDIEEVRSFPSLEGPGVIDLPAFKDNTLCFPVAYGLAIQALGLGQLSTNLVPRELVRERIIRQKQPWAVAAVAILLLATTFNYLVLWWPTAQVRIGEHTDWESAFQKLEAVESVERGRRKEYQQKLAGYNEERRQGEAMMAHFAKRTRWLELMQAVNACLPQHAAGDQEVPDKITDRRQIHVTDLRVERFSDLSQWATPELQDARARTVDSEGLPPGAKAAPARGSGKPAAGAPSAAIAGKLKEQQEKKAKALAKDAPSGPGYVVQITGYHFYAPGDKADDATRSKFVKDTLIKNLAEKKISFPSPDGRGSELRPTKLLGISYPVLLKQLPSEVVLVPNPKFRRGIGGKELELVKYNFIVQFAWQPAEPVEVADDTDDTDEEAGLESADADDRNAVRR